MVWNSIVRNETQHQMRATGRSVSHEKVGSTSWIWEWKLWPFKRRVLRRILYSTIGRPDTQASYEQHLVWSFLFPEFPVKDMSSAFIISWLASGSPAWTNRKLPLRSRPPPPSLLSLPVIGPSICKQKNTSDDKPPRYKPPLALIITPRLWIGVVSTFWSLIPNQ